MEWLGCDAPVGLEWRRLRALHLKQRGWCQRDIADALDVCEESVSRWLARSREGGVEALRARLRLGPAPRLSVDQKRLIPEFLWHGPEAYGFRGELWTCARVSKVIEQEFGICYHKGHVSRLLKELGWTPQVPIRRAIQRDEGAIRNWREVRWPELRRQACHEGRALVFVDESGFYLLPSVVRTYGPQGQTPVVRKQWTRDHLSVMAGLTPAGKLYTLVRRESLSSSESVIFLKHLLVQTGKKLLVIWDGSPIHRWGAVRDYLAAEGGKRIHLEALPGYAPDLSPLDQGCWHHLKDVEMANLSCMDMEELHLEFDLAVGRLRQKPQLIQSFFAAAGLAL